MKYKQIRTGYIVSIGENIGGAGITEDESITDGNVWEPGVYGWEVAE